MITKISPISPLLNDPSGRSASYQTNNTPPPTPLRVTKSLELSSGSEETTGTVGYHIENVKSLLHLAGELKNFITDQKLAASIQGKQYVMVEGWQFAGSMLGLCCIVDTTSLQDLSQGKEIRFRVSAHVYQVKSGKLVASASASCSNSEVGKHGYAAYAVESMAQTRSISKAYRTYLSWLVKAAGFEPTPYEEMPMTVESTTSMVLASDTQYATIARLASSPFIYPSDLPEPVKSAIQNRNLSDKEAKETLLTLRNLIDERNF